MGRRVQNTKALNCRVDANLFQKVQVLLTNPATGKTAYGGLGGLIGMLLNEWLQGVQSGQRPLPDIGLEDND